MERLAIDVFTFSYLNAGINFIDIAKLKHSNIRDNQLFYNREKRDVLWNATENPQGLKIPVGFYGIKK